MYSVHILEGVRAGLIPRVARRLTGFERQSIQPGTVWVWEEGESGCTDEYMEAD
jgi:hypothetical protein